MALAEVLRAQDADVRKAGGRGLQGRWPEEIAMMMPVVFLVLPEFIDAPPASSSSNATATSTAHPIRECVAIGLCARLPRGPGMCRERRPPRDLLEPAKPD
jgi:hypothetical protein